MQKSLLDLEERLLSRMDKLEGRLVARMDSVHSSLSAQLSDLDRRVAKLESVAQESSSDGQFGLSCT